MVLSGGGVKAAAHLGAARALRDASLVPTRYVATSMGAVIAALLASGLTPEEIHQRLLKFRRHDVARPRAASLVQGLWSIALFHAEPLQQTIARLVQASRFDELAVPLTVTAVDLDTSELVCFGAGGEDAPLHDALYAACALPLWYPPALLQGRRLADGGVRSVLPLQVASRFPADLVVAVDTGPGTDAAPASGRLAPPPLVQIYGEAMHGLMSSNTELEVALWRATPGRPTLLYIRPETERGATFAISELSRYEQAGYTAAQRQLTRQTV
jgi:NTE family protein